MTHTELPTTCRVVNGVSLLTFLAFHYEYIQNKYKQNHGTNTETFMGL